MAYRRGEYERAAALHAASLRVSRDIGARELVAASLESVAWVAAAHGRWHRTAQLSGAAEGVRRALGVPLMAELRADHEQAVQAVRAALGAEACAAAWAAGQAMELEEAIAYALQEGEPA